MADGGISERGSSSRRTGASLFYKSPDRRMTEKKSGGTTVTSPSGPAKDLQTDIHYALRNKQRTDDTLPKASAQPASADVPLDAPRDDDIHTPEKRPTDQEEILNKVSAATMSNYDKEKERLRARGRERRATKTKAASAVKS